MSARGGDGELIYDRIEEEAEDAGAQYELTLRGAGLTVERKVSEDVARAIVNCVMGGLEMSATTRAAGRSSDHMRQGRAQDGHARQPGSPRSLREFLDEAEARRNPEKILVIAEYLKDELGQDSFSREDVKGQFRSAGEPIPGNFPRDFSAVVSTGWIAEDRVNGGYYVTTKGRQAIDQRFSADVRRVSRPTRRRRGSRKSAMSGETSDE